MRRPVDNITADVMMTARYLQIAALTSTHTGNISQTGCAPALAHIRNCKRGERTVCNVVCALCRTHRCHRSYINFYLSKKYSARWSTSKEKISILTLGAVISVFRARLTTLFRSEMTPGKGDVRSDWLWVQQSCTSWANSLVYPALHVKPEPTTFHSRPFDYSPKAFPDEN